MLTTNETRYIVPHQGLCCFLFIEIEIVPILVILHPVLVSTLKIARHGQYFSFFSHDCVLLFLSNNNDLLAHGS